MTEREDMQLCHFLAPGNIICHSRATDSDALITELAERVAYNTAGLDSKSILEAVKAREEVLPTVITDGLAVPHARIGNIDTLILAVATSKDGVDFHVAGMGPVKVAVLMLSPLDSPALHLKLLAALARKFSKKETIDTASRMCNVDEIMSVFCCENNEIPRFLRAGDLMDSSPVTLLESDTLHTAIEKLATTGVSEIILLDEDGDLRGVVSQSDILRFSLPEHLLWMDDLSSIYNFQPFAEILREDEETKLADFMREDMVKVDAEVPAIQLAKEFLMQKVDQIVVTRNGKFAGTVTLESFNRKVFWE